jgi:hypothetical protein
MGQPQYYEYEDIEQARMALEATENIIKQFGKVLEQKHYFEYLKLFLVNLSKDVPNEEND